MRSPDVSTSPAIPPLAQAPAAAAPLPPGSPLIGRPNTEGAMKLAPVAPPPIPGETPTSSPPSRQAEAAEGLQHRALCRQRAERAFDAAKATRAPCSSARRLQDKVHYITNKDGKREVKVLVSGLHRPNGPRHQGRHALHRRALEDLQDREGRGQSRQRQDGRDLFRPAEG
jgi:hypothetical protein